MVKAACRTSALRSPRAKVSISIFTDRRSDPLTESWFTAIDAITEATTFARIPLPAPSHRTSDSPFWVRLCRKTSPDTSSPCSRC